MRIKKDADEYGCIHPPYKNQQSKFRIKNYMENTVRKKEVPMFSVGDFKDFSALILKLKNNANSPLYS